jgi:fructose-bisphosphate aldolase, class I
MRLGRLFNAKSGRAFITAIDHGVTLGVPAGAENAEATLSRIVAGGPDAVLIGPGLLEKFGHLFANRGAPATIVRGDFIVNHPFVDDLGEGYRPLISPAEALALGADAIVLFLMVGTNKVDIFADNVRAISQTAQDAHRVGLPLIVEAVLWGTRFADKKDADRLAFGCRLAVELGADAIKTEYTGDADSMRKIIDSCPAPVLLLGGSKSADPSVLLDGTRAAMAVGAKGVIYGRNVWQADDPVAISRSLREIIHG